jgi:phosphatidylserine synthase
MAPLFYGLCTLTALFCAVLLLRAYHRSRYKLLLWGGLCFLGLTLNNALLVVDKLVFPEPEINLFTWRLVAALAAVLVLLYGIIFDAE